MFKVTNKKEIYKNKWLRLSEWYTDHNDKEGIYSVVHRSDTVIIIPITDKQNTLLLKQYRYPIETYSYEFPMGAIDKGETAVNAAKRELLEETGLKVKSLNLIANYYAVPGLTSQQIFVFAAQITENELNTLTSQYDDEIVEVNIKKISEVKEMVKAGKIKDGFTVSAASFIS